MPPEKNDETVLELAGLRIQRPAWNDSFAAVLDRAQRESVRVGWIYANCVNVAAREPRYREDANAFEFLFNDGAGIELAGKILHRPVRDNLCGTDWIPELLTRLEEGEVWTRVFLLGASEPAVQRAAKAVEQCWPKLIVVGAHHGYFDDAQSVLAAIESASPDILIVGMGVPRQERFLCEHWPRLSAAGIRIAIAGGAIIDHLGGTVRRAPLTWRRLRLEWLWRLLTEPRRLWRRYLLGNVEFLWRLVRQWRTSD